MGSTLTPQLSYSLGGERPAIVEGPNLRRAMKSSSICSAICKPSFRAITWPVFFATHHKMNIKSYIAAAIAAFASSLSSVYGQAVVPTATSQYLVVAADSPELTNGAGSPVPSGPATYAQSNTDTSFNFGEIATGSASIFYSGNTDITVTAMATVTNPAEYTEPDTDGLVPAYSGSASVLQYYYEVLWNGIGTQAPTVAVNFSATGSISASGPTYVPGFYGSATLSTGDDGNDLNNGSEITAASYIRTRLSENASSGPFSVNQVLIIPTDTLEDVQIAVSAVADPGADPGNLGQTTSSIATIDPLITTSTPGYSIEFSPDLTPAGVSAVPDSGSTLLLVGIVAAGLLSLGMRPFGFVR
jgi:hypothetical protein